jgi:hypothetical protein
MIGAEITENTEISNSKLQTLCDLRILVVPGWLIMFESPITAPELKMSHKFTSPIRKRDLHDTPFVECVR